MKPKLVHVSLLSLSLLPIAVFSAQTQAAPTSEQVYKDIKVFKGVPASDLIPAMEFMSASLKYKCADCHNPNDYAAPHPKKDEARKMVLMQREINDKHFNGRLEVTCNSCHNGQDHPAGTPIPTGVVMRHERIQTTLKPDDLFKKHVASVGEPVASVIRTGTLTAPSDVTHKIETTPLETVQSEGGKFRLVSGARTVISNGQKTWYGAYEIADEPAHLFGRLGRPWTGDQAFAGLERTSIAGKDKIGKTEVLVVRGSRAATGSTEELYFDSKSGLLLRMVNIKRSTIGSVLSVYDYSNYKTVNGLKVPMKVTLTFAGGDQWIMDFKTSKTDTKVDEALFKSAG